MKLAGRWVVGVCLVLTGASSVNAAWVAYNDCLKEAGDGTQANVTTYTIHNSSQTNTSGPLKDYATGSTAGMPAVTFTMGPAGLSVSGGGAAGRPNSGTPAFEVFHEPAGAPIVDLAPNNIYYGSTGWWQQIAFNGLDPGKTYTFVGTAIRSSSYPDRKSLVTILGHVSAVNNSSSGPNILSKSETTTVLLAGDNRAAGDVVRWDDIVPASNGTFTIRCEATADAQSRAYAINAFMLAEGGVAGNRPPIVDAGDYDALTWPINVLQLSPIVDDDDPCGLGILTYEWSRLSGPGTATFVPSHTIADPCVIFSEPGLHKLQLRVWDEVPLDGVGTVEIPLIMGLLGDFNGDRRVNHRDVEIFAAQWMDPWPSPADLNARDGVNVVDLSILAANWGVGEEATLVINEVLARNDLSNPDPQGQYEDWVEIYNGGQEAFDLGGCHLTDRLDEPTMWRVPTDRPQATTIAAGGYLIIWLDGDVNDAGLHASFELAESGERVALFDADGRTLLDKIEFGPQTADVSFGREPDGTNNWVTLTPSPGASNNGRFLGVVADTKFSHNRGFYSTPFEVIITTSTPGATIVYTTDGSTPTETHGSVYTAPVPIITTTPLRAFAYRTGWKSTNVDTQTYIFLDHVIAQATHPTTGAQVTPAGLPVSWGSVTGDYQMDPDVVGQSGQDKFGGIYAASIRSDLRAVPTFSLVMNKDDFFGPTGIYINQSQDGTERVCSLEYIDPNENDSFQMNCALAMQGGVSGGGTSLDRWKTYKLSMRPRFKALTDDLKPTQGAPRMSFKLFQDSPVDSHNTFVFDAVLNHSWLHSGQHTVATYIQDQFTADLHNAMNGPSSPHGFYGHVYICGLYWGVYYIHERPDHAWAAEVYGGRSEEYDALKHGSGGVVQNGLGGSATANYNAMVSASSAVRSDPTNLTKWQALTHQLDVDNFITYLMANWFLDNGDWPGKNWYATHRSVPGGQWRFHSWDAEHTLENNGNGTFGASPSGIHANLAPSPEYKMRFADLAYRAFFNGGPLSEAVAADLLRHRMATMDPAIVGESARWGDNRSTNPHTRQEWLNLLNSRLTSYIPSRPGAVLGYLRTAGLYPDIDPPTFFVGGGFTYGGQIQPTDPIVLMGSGTVYYTTDGADPRLPGGGVNSAHAAAYSGPFTLARSAAVKARVLSGSTWSALAQAQFSVGPVAQSLKISEVMFNPGDTGDPEDPNTEYIELTNVGTQAINLNLVEFTNGVRFTFGDYTLAPGAYTLVVAKQAAFEAKHGSALPVAGEYIGRLDNAGERVTLEDAAGAVIHSFRYRDGWYAITDGLGFSLTVVDPSLADANSLEDKASWRPSAAVGGSAGFDDSGVLPPLGSVKINEVLAHAHAEASDWIELHNTTAQAINIGGWFLSDSDANFKKYEIAAGTSIPANGYIVFYQNLHFGNAADPGAHEMFALSENGEAAYVHSGSGGQLTGYVEEESFGASETGVAFGRYLKSTGTYNFVAMSSNTPGAANAYPKVGPVVINEIMYNPPVNGDAEYVELRNITGVPVSLQTWDNESSVYVAWRLTDDDGITYDFPLNTTIPAGGYLLVVRSLAAFNSSYPGAPAGVQKLEWVNGRLDNAGEKVELSLPGDVNPSTGSRYYIRVDRVNYSDGSHPVGGDPWPTGADGGGQSLTRISSSAYGNDVINWKAATPSPGTANP